ncbi:MAG: hypothetical protein CME36_12155 [unclassified Hahellaceae]|nr:hypothetical protein [Hahellaceae bacterium]|tara:strand:+ start:15246 stop:16352 length:1107 start_codon:yes stop_codon:yes gene_type:complete
MKLSIIMDRYDNPYAGTESQVLKLVSGLKEQGWDIQFAVLRGTDYTRSGMFPVPVHDLGVGSISSPGSWFKMYRYARSLRKQGFSVVHAFFNDASVIAPPTMRLAGLKTLISRRDMGFWYSGTYLKALRLTGRCVHAAVCNSKAVAEITSRFEKMPPGKIHVIYNGYPDMSSGEQVSAPWESRSEAEVVVGIVANLRPIKRIDDLIEAIGLLAREGLHLKLNVIGGGDPHAYMEQVRRLGLEGHVHLLGSQPEPERHIRDFDIAVLCSETEGFSNAIIEYMRCGKPVVCTRTGGNPEIVEEGLNGYLVPVGDVEALADRIRKLAENPQLREKMGKVGRSQLADKYSMKAMVAKHVELYSQIEPGMVET